MPTSFIKFLCFGIGLLLCTNTNAQWDAGTSGNLGANYGQIALSLNA